MQLLTVIDMPLDISRAVVTDHHAYAKGEILDVSSHLDRLWLMFAGHFTIS